MNAYFRWENITDTPLKFAINLWLKQPKTDFMAENFKTSTKTAVTLRRLQKFKVEPTGRYQYQLTRGDKPFSKGEISADARGLLTIPDAEITTEKTTLTLSPLTAEQASGR